MTKKSAKKAAKKKAAKRHNKTVRPVTEQPEPVSFPDGMPERHRLFAMEYLQDYNATRAYKAVYKVTDDSTARTNGWRLLTNADIKEVIKRETDRAVDAYRARLQHLVIRSLDETLSAQMADYRDESGDLDFDRLDLNGTAIAGVTRDVYQTEDGTRIKTSITLESKARAREQAMKMTGLLSDAPPAPPQINVLLPQIVPAPQIITAPLPGKEGDG